MKMKDAEEKQSATIKEFKVLVDGFDGAFWGQIQSKLIAKANDIESSRNAKFLKLSEVELKISKTEEITLRFIAKMPVDIVNSYQELVKQNAQLKEDIRDYERRLKKSL
jgi:hypothetical protein